MIETRDVVILGSGPAGYTAALYAARANLRPLVLKGLEAGGQLMLTTEVENYPGFRDGILGPDLMQAMRAQCARFGTEIQTRDVERVDFSTEPFRVWSEGEQLAARSVIVATGAKARLMGVPGESELMGRGVSTCATCDGAFFREKVISVVGGGDSAAEEATFLTRFGRKVVLLHRRDELRASKIMQERVFTNPKIEVLWNTVVVEAEGDGKLERLRVQDVTTGEERTMASDALFVAIGHTPTTEFLGGQLELDPAGYVVTHDGSRTSVPGVFACGDCQDHVYRQAVTAAGSGCMAAIDCERWLEARAHA